MESLSVLLKLRGISNTFLGLHNRFQGRASFHFNTQPKPLPYKLVDFLLKFPPLPAFPFVIKLLFSPKICIPNAKKKKGKKNASSNPTTQTSPVCFFPHHHCAPGQPSMCMFVQTPPGGSSHWSYSAAVSSPCSVPDDPPAACLHFSNRRHCDSCICRACCAQPPARGLFWQQSWPRHAGGLLSGNTAKRTGS